MRLSRTTRKLLFFAIINLLLASLVRFIGLAWGTPRLADFPSYGEARGGHPQWLLHPDEYVYASIPFKMVVTRYWNPKYYQAPAFTPYLNAVSTLLTGAADGLTVEGRAAYCEQVAPYTDCLRAYAPFDVYFMARAYSALFGVLMVALLIATLRRLAGAWAAYAGGLFAAVAYSLVQHSHYGTPNVTAAAWVALTLLAGLQALRRRGQPDAWRWLIVAGVGSGLAMGTRYNAAVISLVPLLIGGLLWAHQRTWGMAWRVFVGWVAFPISFLITTPGALLDMQFFLEELRSITTQYFIGFARPISPWEGLVYEWRYLAVYSLGLPMSLLALIGAAYVLWHLRAAWRSVGAQFGAVLLLFVLAYSLLVLRTVRPTGADQLLMPVIPAVLLLAAVGGAWAARLGRWHFVARNLVLMFAIVVPVLQTGMFLAALRLPDTRQQTADWIAANLPTGTRFLLIGAQNVPLDAALYPSYQRFEPVPPAEPDAGYDYLIFSDALYFSSQRDPSRTPEQRFDLSAQWVSFEANYPLVYTSAPRLPWWGIDDPLHTASYWHQPVLRVYCLDLARCPYAIQTAQAR